MKKKKSTIKRKSSPKSKRKISKSPKSKKRSSKLKQKFFKNPDPEYYSKLGNGVICDLCNAFGPNINWVDHQPTCPERNEPVLIYKDIDGTTITMNELRRRENIRGF